MSEKCSALFSYTDCIPTVSVYTRVCVCVCVHACICVCVSCVLHIHVYVCVCVRVPVWELLPIDLLMGIIREYLITSKYGPKVYSNVSSLKTTKTLSKRLISAVNISH